MFFSLPFLAFFLLYFFAIFQLEGVANSQKKSPLKALQAIFWFCLSRIQLKLFALSCVCFERTIKMQFGRAASTQRRQQWSHRMQSARRAANSTPGPRSWEK